MYHSEPEQTDPDLKIVLKNGRATTGPALYKHSRLILYSYTEKGNVIHASSLIIGHWSGFWQVLFKYYTIINRSMTQELILFLCAR